MNLILAQITSNDNLFLGLVTTGGGAMAAAIAHIYLASGNKDKALVEMVVAKNKEVVEIVQKELDECKKDRADLRKMYYELNGKFSAISKDQ